MAASANPGAWSALKSSGVGSFFNRVPWGAATSVPSTISRSGSSASFMKLAEEPDREIVLGTLVAAPQGTRLKKDPTPDDFKALHAPGFALAAMNFRLEYAANGETVLTTETRVSATDASVRKKFGA